MSCYLAKLLRCTYFGFLSIGVDLYYFFCNLETNVMIPLFSSDLFKCLCVCGFSVVYLQFSRDCGRVPRSGGGSGWASVPSYCTLLLAGVDGFTRLSYFYWGVL